jgi:hypothetical protein
MALPRKALKREALERAAVKEGIYDCKDRRSPSGSASLSVEMLILQAVSKHPRPALAGRME